jgi:hypothetical protein
VTFGEALGVAFGSSRLIDQGSAALPAVAADVAGWARERAKRNSAISLLAME